MNSKERVKTALTRGCPDRAPVYAEFVPEVEERLKKHFGMDDITEIGVALGNDMVMAGAGIGKSFYGAGEEYVCPWGCRWKYFRNSEGSYTEIIGHPLADDVDGEKLAAYRIPDPDAPGVYAPVQELVRKYGDTHFIGVFLACSIFEAGWYIRGFERTLMDMAADPDYAHALFDKVMEFPLRAGLRMLDEGADLIWLGDDVGMQHRMIMSVDMWRTFLKPRLAKLIASFKAKREDIIIAYHSCGYIEPIIEDLIEIGLDVLNPIQPLAMDPAVIKAKYGDRLSFWGAVCVQETLPKGSREDIRREIALRMETIGKGGGYMVSPAHTIQADTSVDNIFALYEAVRELGGYGEAGGAGVGGATGEPGVGGAAGGPSGN